MERPRLCCKGRRGKEVEIPAYTAIQNQSPLGGRILDTLLRSVSTRNYKDVIPQMAETVPLPYSHDQVSYDHGNSEELSKNALGQHLIYGQPNFFPPC